MARMSASIMALGLLTILANMVSGSKFRDAFIISENRRVGPIVEGPMYGTDGGFIGIMTGTPFVGFEGTGEYLSGDEEVAEAEADLTIFHTSSHELLPIYDKSLPMEQRYRNISSVCDTVRGVITQETLNGFGKLESHKVFRISGNEGVADISFKSPVLNTGYQYIVFALCRKHSGLGEIGTVDVEIIGDLIFRNPYGYLPAKYYGFLPFLGVLSSLYLILLLVFTYLSIRHRKTMLRMQWGILGVIAMGMIETTTWFFTYVVMNDTGATSCCPWRNDIVFAMISKNLKQAVSGMLVLAVALGWGVVRPNLSKKTTLLVVFLGFFYFAFSVKFDLVRMERITRTTSSTDDADGGGNSAFWAFPVALCDVLFILSIYFGLNETSLELENDHQDEKLKMYQILSRTLRLWAILWLVFTIFDLLTRIGFIPWPWSLEFLLWGFWDVLYLAVLVRIAIIWRPTETSDRYAYSAQLPTDNVLDEFESQDFERHSEAQEMEMTKT